MRRKLLYTAAVYGLLCTACIMATGCASRSPRTHIPQSHVRAAAPLRLPPGYIAELCGLSGADERREADVMDRHWGFRYTPDIAERTDLQVTADPAQPVISGQAPLALVREHLGPRVYRNSLFPVRLRPEVIEEMDGHGMKDMGIAAIASFLFQLTPEALDDLKQRGVLLSAMLPDVDAGLTLEADREEVGRRFWSETWQKMTGGDIVLAHLAAHNRDEPMRWTYLGAFAASNSIDKQIQAFLEEQGPAAQAEFRGRYGFDMPLGGLSDSDPKATAKRIHFWRYLLDKAAWRRQEVYAAQKRLLQRQDLPSQILTHEHPKHMLIYPKLMWDTCDGIIGHTCGTAIPDELGRQYWAGFTTRVAADLCHQPLVVGALAGMLNHATPYRPTPALIEDWYSQIIQNGVEGVYIWPRDFRGSYSLPDGRRPTTRLYTEAPMPGVEGQERWDAEFGLARLLGNSRAFQPPRADIAVFVSIDSTLVEGWEPLFSAYIELRKAGLWHQYVSDDGILAGKEKLEDYKLLLVPHMPFQNREALAKLRAYVEAGGILLAGNPRVMAYDDAGEGLASQRRDFFGLTAVKQRGEPAAITALVDGRAIPLESFGPQTNLVPAEGAAVVARYADGLPAAIEQRLGAGRAIFCGFELADAYRLHEGQHRSEAGRLEFYRALTASVSARAQGWVYSVRIKDVYEATSQAAARLGE